MQIISSPEIMQKTALELRRQGRRIGLVPTMGFLHEGHISLGRLARREADVIVFSIFVNPRQFGPQEDFAGYPRDLARDTEICRQNGVDIIFNPSAKDMYPGFAEGPAFSKASPKASSAEASLPDNTVFIDENDLAKQLCGKSRPSHFRGVLTVVGKLFNLVLPDLAVFGQKDAQQAILIRQMIRDLNFPVRMIIAPIIRASDGLALSSRNAYLSPDERRAATCLSAALKSARRLYRSGERSGPVLKAAMVDLIAKVRSASIDYVEIMGERARKPLDKTSAEDILVALA
ncbi:MAG: pantoate--beta-alanine ligase, partial [Kiritimatiellia bacterium]|nr:pantoate--beta-alanine ligase [Kiritimatiellia bacterium]